MGSGFFLFLFFWYCFFVYLFIVGKHCLDRLCAEGLISSWSCKACRPPLLFFFYPDGSEAVSSRQISKAVFSLPLPCLQLKKSARPMLTVFKNHKYVRLWQGNSQKDPEPKVGFNACISSVDLCVAPHPRPRKKWICIVAILRAVAFYYCPSCKIHEAYFQLCFWVFCLGTLTHFKNIQSMNR